MELTRNAFKHGLAAPRAQVGLWSTLCSNIAAEVVADAGFDWILFDTEHSPNELPGLLAQLQAMGTSPTSPVVRVAWNDPVLIKRTLDLGVQSLLIPYVQNLEEARRAVASVRYPPAGIRGVSAGSRASRYGRIPGYLSRAQDEICLLVQLETRAALDPLEAIAGLEGIDGVFIGPADLAASFGELGNPQAPLVQAAICEAAARLARVGKAAGILAVSEADTARYLDWGYGFVAVGVDTQILARGCESLVKRFKSAP
ncbi:MAG TPA: HpcH/HpaI aldolase/citrate lyase family protein [Steroidobacteraceae bacterium]|nr:HpcH/HpaI aldolase/citrate lyase family protein [Steroidobacteraceae bacterium]